MIRLKLLIHHLFFFSFPSD